MKKLGNSVAKSGKCKFWDGAAERRQRPDIAIARLAYLG